MLQEELRRETKAFVLDEVNVFHILKINKRLDSLPNNISRLIKSSTDFGLSSRGHRGASRARKPVAEPGVRATSPPCRGFRRATPLYVHDPLI